MNRLIHGDALYSLIKVKEKSVQMCVTSPPYYNLRDYGVSGQIGLENTIQEYINKLVKVFREVRRVLKDDGKIYRIATLVAVKVPQHIPIMQKNTNREQMWGH